MIKWKNIENFVVVFVYIHWIYRKLLSINNVLRLSKLKHSKISKFAELHYTELATVTGLLKYVEFASSCVLIG